MTDIQKMIEKEAREYMYSPKAHTGHYTDVQIEEYRYDGFIDGAKLVLSQLQHANRWRKVSENEYPQVQDEQYQILVRVSGIPYSATMWNIRDEKDCDIMRRLSSSVEWKPIS